MVKNLVTNVFKYLKEVTSKYFLKKEPTEVTLSKISEVKRKFMV